MNSIIFFIYVSYTSDQTDTHTYMYIIYACIHTFACTEAVQLTTKTKLKQVTKSYSNFLLLHLFTCRFI